MPGEIPGTNEGLRPQKHKEEQRMSNPKQPQRQVVVRMVGPAALIFSLFEQLCQREGNKPIGDLK